jgi:hypothetical protein
MSSGFMPSVIVGASAGEVSPQRRWPEQSSPHFYPTAGLLNIEQKGRAWGGVTRRRKRSGRSIA